MFEHKGVDCLYPKNIIEKLNEIAPVELAEGFDCGKIGLIVEGTREPVRIATALDATKKVVCEAVGRDIDLLIVHHTPIWHPITSVTGSHAELLREVLTSGMHVFVMHTNYDNAPKGVNACLCDLLSLSDCVPMSGGIVGTVSLSLAEIQSRLNAPLLVHNAHICRGSNSSLNFDCSCDVNELRLGVVGGSGFDPALIDQARSLGAAAFLSAELKHSVMRQYPDMVLLESTHYALEAPSMRILAHNHGWIYIDDAPSVALV